MSELCSKFQIPASNSVGGVAETKLYYSVIWSKYISHSGVHNSAIMSWIKFCFLHVHVQCISELCFKCHVPASNTLVGVAETRIVLQCDMVQNMCHSRGCNSAIMTFIKFCFLYAHVQCISELCFKYQVPASNILGGVAETRTVLKTLTDVRTYVRLFARKRVKLYAPPHFVAGA